MSDGIVDGWVAVFLAGTLGGVLLELVKLAAWRDAEKIGVRYVDPRYWIGTAALLLLAGLVAVLNGTSHVAIRDAVQYGMNAPAIIAGYATAQVHRGRKGFMGEPAKRPRITELFSWL